MEPLDVQQEYAELLRQARAAVRNGRGAEERRSVPRFAVQTDDLWSETLPHFQPMDLSATGIALASEEPLPVGERIEICLGGVLRARAEVVQCELIESATQYNAAEFRIHCRFIAQRDGMELLVRVKRLERLQQDSAEWFRS